MPQLTKLRFVNLGHSNARVEDLTLSLENKDTGRADDTILWLRNGGGKTMLFSLFFALLVPHRKQFLGNNQGGRQIEDYVRLGDCAVVIAEWQLDAPTDGLPVRYLTGCFCQRQQDEKLDRLFFASRVSEPEITFENVPIKTETGARRTLYNFRQAWQNLTKRHPAAEAHETNRQDSWRDILEQAWIDPELFVYQIHMNSQEGGAEKLFASFSIADHYVDFFVKMMMPAEQSEVIASDLKSYRNRLRERKSLQAELTLVESLTPKIEPMLGAAARRQKHREYAGELRSRIEQARMQIEAQQAANARAIVETEKLLADALIAAGRADEEARSQNERQHSLERLRFERRAKRLENELKNLEKQLDEMTHSHLVWKAAWLYADVARIEASVHALEGSLRLQDAELAPDWEEIRASARALAGALLARAEENRRAAESKTSEAARHRERAKDARRKSGDARIEIGRIENQARTLAERIEQARASRVNLKNAGTIDENEPLQPAFERRERELNEIEQRKSLLTTEAKNAQQLFDSLAVELGEAGRESLQAQQATEAARKILSDARDKQNKLLVAPVLKRVFGEVSREILNRQSLDTLRTERAALEAKLRESGATVAENEFIYDYLQAHDLLPPTRDVRAILKVLEENGIVGFAGWERVAEMCRTREAARTFIAAHPEIALGVIIPDKNFASAKAALAGASLQLSTSVVVVPRRLADALDGADKSDAANRFVVGPTSDAHFESAAAKDEAVRLEIHLRRERDKYETIEREESELRATVNDLQAFIAAHPKDWFEQSEAEARAAENYFQECLARIVALEKQHIKTREIIIQSEQNLVAIAEDKGRAEEHLRRLNLHRDRHGTDEQLIEITAQKAAGETRARELSAEAERLDREAEAENEQARRFEDEAKDFNAEAEKNARQTHNVRHFEDEPLPAAGDVERLQDVHQRLCDRIEQKTDAGKLSAEIERAKASFSEAKKRFDDERDEKITVDEIGKALKDAPDKNTIQTRIAETDKRKSDLQKSVYRAEWENEGAQKDLTRHRSEHPQLKIGAEEERNETIAEDELERRARAAQTAANVARARAREHKDETNRLEKESMRLQSQGGAIGGWRGRVENIIGDEVFLDAVESAAFAGQMPELEEAVLRQLEKKVIDARKLGKKLIDERGMIYKKFLERLENEPFEFAAHLRNWGEEYLEANAQRALDELGLRGKTIRAELGNSEAVRKTIVELLLGEAERGLKSLRNLANHSKLPDSAGNLAGRAFLKIEFETPESRAERSERVGNLIDDIVQQEQLPDAAEIVQRAVRKLPQKPIAVSVLFPDVDAFKSHYRPITTMASESGGEHLTSAVLIYCALMRQRAVERGTNQKTSSVLLLDNPFGKATRRKFVELQRATARAMNIQLVYSTAIDSPDALGTFRNFVRLRNERRNSGSGDCLLEAAHETLP